ncbi:lipid A export permease/ATP-binding protein MsbA [Alcanivorax sp. 1008]|uniref:lipid A export permease/ATP-binding protein MsbA n=1 Tax=Alcanivorax sp. 1008 TaxID=2816853 RepID=UPI001D3D9476|nr:lipid A export permease/ATP-binding protein MsbA [Alcanivorax sp. 1008]MCC1496305.1 lipid A export permease/ATP-binding protein MsbA [Alcanivorax sp. 1008]
MKGTRGKPPEDVWPIYRRLLRYTRRYWYALVISALGFALYSSMQPVTAHMMQVIVDTFENPTPIMILVVSLAPLMIALINGIGQFIGSYSVAWLGQHIVFEIRNEVFHHVLALPQRVFQRNATGRITSKLVFDAQQITAAGSEAVVIIIREGLSVIALLGYLLYLDWKLTLILFTVAPAVGAVVNYSGKRFRAISRRMQGNMGNISHYVSEAIDGQQPVKIFAAQDQERERFHKVSRSFEKQNVKMVATKEVGTMLVHMVISGGVGLIIYLCFVVMNENFSIGSFLTFFTGVGLIQQPIKRLTEVNVKIQRGLTGAASLFELLDTPPEQDAGTRSLQRARGEIEFRDVSFGYEQDQPVLKGLSFSVAAGESVALVGRSGAGKTTISSLLPRFYDVDGGQILLDGHPLTEYRLADLRRQIAMVSQKVVLFNDSVRNNIAYGELRDATDEQVIAALEDAHAWEFVQALDGGLDAHIGQDGTQLSGGQRQRLAIARALLKDAPILILDEATSALDTESEFRIQQALERVMAGRTTLVIAHRLSTIERADRIMVLDEGHLVESGSHSELLVKEGAYAQLYRMNFEEH